MNAFEYRRIIFVSFEEALESGAVEVNLARKGGLTKYELSELVESIQMRKDLLFCMEMWSKQLER